MYGSGVTLLAIAGGIYILFGRYLWLGDGRQPYPIRLDELFYWGQWTAFWIALASLALLVAERARAGNWISWRSLAPLIALLLCGDFIVASMPEKSNRNTWASGDLGLRVYLETKRRAKGEGNSQW